MTNLFRCADVVFTAFIYVLQTREIPMEMNQHFFSKICTTYNIAKIEQTVDLQSISVEQTFCGF